LPVPPRSVIIERLPAAPAKPRDIIIERWIPYGAAAKRQTKVIRAEVAKGYAKPRNVIIQYEPIQVRVVRQFQRLGVTQENPQAYLQRYGAQLLEAQILLQQARAAGVIEDISPPAGAAGINVSSSSFSQESSFGAGGAGGAEFGGVAGGEFGGASASFSSSGYEGSQSGGIGGGLAGAGFESGLVEGAGGAYGSSSFESSSYSSGGAGGADGFSAGGAGGFGGEASFGGGQGGGFSSSSYESSSFSSGGGAAGGAGGAGGFDVIAAAFNSADKNKDGTVDANEFKQFYQGGL